MSQTAVSKDYQKKFKKSLKRGQVPNFIWLVVAVDDERGQYMSLFSTLLSDGGYACYCLGSFTNDGRKKWSHNFTESVEQLNIYRADNRMDCNNYLSVSTFKNGSRRSEFNVKEVKRLFIDMDAHDNPINYDEAKLLSDYMLDNWFDGEELPEPNYIIFSGRGLQVLFTLNGCDNVPEWKQYQTALLKTCQTLLEQLKHHSLSEAGDVALEHNVEIDVLKDAARVMRVPDTTNLKQNVDAKLLYSDEEHEYTLHELNTNYIAFNNDNLCTIEEKKTQKKTKSKEKKKKPKSEPTERNVDMSNIDMDDKQIVDPNFLKIIENTIKPRLFDLETLIRARNEAGIDDGYRNNLIAIYIPTLVSCGYKNEEVVKEAHRINSLFNKPLKQAEVNDWLNSCLKKKEIVNADGKKCVSRVYYRFYTNTIIDKLQITPEEQEAMKVLCDEKLKKKRSREKQKDIQNANRREVYAQKTADKRKAKEERNNRIHELSADGMSARQIAKQLGVNVSTVSRVLKK